MDHRTERIRLETPRHVVTGLLTLPREGYRSRITDFLNAGDREFIALRDATVRHHDGSEEERHEFIAIGRAHVVMITPLGEVPA